MDNIIELFNDFKSEVEKKQFVEKQYTTILSLIDKNKKLEEEITHLKELLSTSTPLINEYKVERIIITPEEALIDTQIQMIQMRGLDRELTLEDTKKLDLLLKNKKIIKEQSHTIESESKKFDKKNLSNKELIQIALTKKQNDN